MAHARLAPSSAERWWNCAASPNAQASVPPLPTSPHAAEGSVAHELLELVMNGKLTISQLQALVGTTRPHDGHDIPVTDEMVDAVIEFYDLIEKDAASLIEGGGSQKIRWASEIKVAASSADSEIKGTADFLLFSDKILKVYDFKYGKGVVVDPTENKQMAIYGIGAMDTLGLKSADVELIIVQPRAGGVRRWTAPKGWLDKFRTELRRRAAATRDPKAPFAAGAWCRWCAVEATCAERFADTQKQAMVDFDDQPKPNLLPDISRMPLDKLVKALEHEDYVTSWFEAVRNHVRSLLEAGLPVPGYKLVQGATHRKFADEKKVVEEFEPILGAEALYERKLISPAKLEKIVGKGKLDHLTFKPEGPKSIAREDDPRPAVANSASADFPALPGKESADDLLKELETAPKKKSVKKVWP